MIPAHNDSRTQRRPRSGASLLMTLALLFGCDEMSEAPASASAPALLVEVEDGHVTVRARAAELDRVLREIARRSELVLLTEEVLDERVTLTVQRQPLPRVLAQLLGQRSFLLQSPPDGRSSGVLWVFTKGTVRSPRGEPGKTHHDELTPAAAAALLTDATSGASINAQLDAISVLSQIDSEQALAALSRAAVNAPDADVRRDAVFALGSIASAARLALVSDALADPSPEVRIAGVAALEEIGGKQAAAALAPALTDVDPRVRTAAVDALGEIGENTNDRRP